MRSRSKVCLALSLAVATVAFADLTSSYIVPLDDETIRYSQRPADDPVERLNRKIASGEVKLEYDGAHGYLRSVLQALGIPVESQMLVFSKTSFQATRISPRRPRALYFNDTTAVGSVYDSDLLEFASVDPKLGVVFYTLNQEKVGKPHFDRRDNACLQCHDNGGTTLGVPGMVVRSVYPDPTGMPVFQAGDFNTDDRSPFKERWGGWYVTGTHGAMTHMGNSVVRDPDHPEKLEGATALNVTDIRGKFDSVAYLAPHSDIVALMTLEHQARMTNLITRVGYETAIAQHDQARINQAYHQPADEMSESTRHRIDNAVEEMVQYMFFVDEAKLDAPVKGTSGFAQAFERAGVRDRQGRSLRDFDLETRLFRYPLSYMIYTEAFDNMPEAARERIYRRLFDVLTGKEKSPRHARLSATDRRAILEILLDTKKDLPAYWQTSSARAQLP
jgi:hypothetical protein